MIQRIRHRGLRELHERGGARGVDPRHTTRLRLILAALDRAENLRDLGVLGLGLHPLSGARDGYYAVRVSGNWRVLFRFEDGDATDIDYLDYH